jgi:hypothetical protein
MTNYQAGMSGKENRIIPRWLPNKKRTGYLSPTVRDHYLSFATFPTPLVSHWSLPIVKKRGFKKK